MYNIFFKRTSTYVLTILVGAVFFERVFDYGLDSLWDKINRGVSISIGAHHNKLFYVVAYLSETMETHKA